MQDSTCGRKRSRLSTRLDYFIASENLTDVIDKCNIKQGYQSNHSFIELIITLCKFEHGRGLWNFNCSLLSDKEYLININNVIDWEKIRFAVSIYNQHNLTNLHNSSIEFTISDSDFLEILLL